MANRRLVFGLILNVLLSYVMIPRFGLVGAAMATVISRAMASDVGQLFARDTAINFKMMAKSMFRVMSLNLVR